MASEKPIDHGPPPPPDPLGPPDPKATDAPPRYQPPFAAITLTLSDRIRLLNFPAPDVRAAREIVAGAWEQGIQDVREEGRATEIKLMGNPWFDRYGGNHSARKLIRGILGGLFERGWVAQAPVDLSRGEGEKDTLIFRFQSPRPPPTDWLTISLDRADRLRLLDPSSQALQDAILATYGSRVKEHTIKNGSFEVKFRGSTWLGGEEAVERSVVVLELLGVLEGFGWAFYAGVEKTDGLYFQRRRAWVPGEEVYHR